MQIALGKIHFCESIIVRTPQQRVLEIFYWQFESVVLCFNNKSGKAKIFNSFRHVGFFENDHQSSDVKLKSFFYQVLFVGFVNIHWHLGL